MTNEEAAKWLEAIREKYIHGGDEGFDQKRNEAIDLAIAALERDRMRERVSVGNVMEYRHVKYDPDVFFHHKPQTKADRIRAMSDEELAKYLSKVQGDIFRGEMRLTPQWLDWLKQEASE